jgi:hypothetical protein
MKFANQRGYSDVTPYEIIRVISEITIEIREMSAVKNDAVKTNFVVGGFSAISDNAQDWIISPDETNPVIRIRASKSKGWADKHGHRYTLCDKPVKFYDYNF